MTVKNGAAGDTKALPGNNGSNSLAERFNSEKPTTILKALYAESGSWREVANKVGNVSAALCWKVAHERCDSDKIASALGLQPATKPVEVCPGCGQVHEQKATCPDKLEKQRRKRKKQHTVAIRFDSAEEAAAFRQVIDSHPDGRTAWARAVVACGAKGDD